METSAYSGFALILSALTPVMLAIVGYFATRDARRAKEAAEVTAEKVATSSKVLEEKLDGVHVLVNDNMTREKAATLVALKAQLVSLGRLPEPNTEDKAVIVALQKQITSLEEEIAARDRAAASLNPTEK